MNALRVLYHLARADLLERTRRYGFLIVLGATILAGVFLVPPQDARYTVGMDVHEVQGPLHFRGVYNSAWIGSMIALMVAFFLSLVGFYLVKNALERDRRTGVGEIIAATPLAKLTYILGKWLSNLSVLAIIAGILVVVALVMQLVRGEDLRVDLGVLVAPFLFVSLPVLALTAAVALLFETLPGLRGGLGNVAYFFMWIGTFFVEIAPNLFGVDAIGSSVMAAAEAAFPQYELWHSIGVNPEVPGVIELGQIQTFRWAGVHWTPEIILERLAWTGLALGVVLLAAVLFDRFDPAGGFFRWLGLVRRPARPAAGPAASAVAPASAPVPVTALTPAPRRFRFWRMLWAELRLTLKGVRWWWYTVAAGLILAGLLAPDDEVRRWILPLVWLWPVLIWSAMGVREARYRTGELVFSTAHALRRQLPATWLAGAAVAMLAGSGVALRWASAGDWGSLLTWIASVLFVPALAVALGVWTGSSKLFEVVYVVWWNMAVNWVAPLDFMGVMGGSETLTCVGVFTMEIAGLPWYYLGLTVILLSLAVAGRRRQIGI